MQEFYYKQAATSQGRVADPLTRPALADENAGGVRTEATPHPSGDGWRKRRRRTPSPQGRGLPSLSSAFELCQKSTTNRTARAKVRVTTPSPGPPRLKKTPGACARKQPLTRPATAGESAVAGHPLPKGEGYSFSREGRRDGPRTTDY